MRKLEKQIRNTNGAVNRVKRSETILLKRSNTMHLGPPPGKIEGIEKIQAEDPIAAAMKCREAAGGATAFVTNEKAAERHYTVLNRTHHHLKEELGVFVDFTAT